MKCERRCRLLRQHLISYLKKKRLFYQMVFSVNFADKFSNLFKNSVLTCCQGADHLRNYFDFARAIIF